MRPRGLGRAGGKLWDEITASVPDGWELDGRDLALLRRACDLADTEADLRASVAADGQVIPGSRGQPVLHPAVREARQTTVALSAVLRRIELKPPQPGTRHLSKRARDQLADARRARWPRAGG
jgi:hypothetical protein